jgi:hypothetical protein
MYSNANAISIFLYGSEKNVHNPKEMKKCTLIREMSSLKGVSVCRFVVRM